MALADYYERAALAASQVIAGFDADLFRQTLEQANVGLAIGREAATSDEGKALADLSVRLLARLYPCLDLRVESSAEGESLESLARMINPRIEFRRGASVGITIGSGAPTFDTTYFAGSDGWDALLSVRGPAETGSSPNPLGAGAAACLAAGRVFSHLLMPESEQRQPDDVRFSTFYCEKAETPVSVANADWTVTGETVLVGLGAVGNGAIWVLGRSHSAGNVHLVDHEVLEVSNVQRYVLAARADEGRSKVDIAKAYFHGGLTCIPHEMRWAQFVQEHGYRWRQVLVALDTAGDRRSVQGALPEWIANAWTQPGDLGVSVHARFDGKGACLSCLYLPTGKVPNEDELVAAALGVPSLVSDIRTLLHTGVGLPRPVLEAVARGLQRPLEEVLVYEGRPIRELYVEGVCGGRLIPLGSIGLPRQELHVPLAHQSALAGVLLSSALLRRAVTPEGADATMITRIDVAGPLGDFLTQPTLKAGTGLCVCEDQDYLQAFQAKYSQGG